MIDGLKTRVDISNPTDVSKFSTKEIASKSVRLEQATYFAKIIVS